MCLLFFFVAIFIVVVDGGYGGDDCGCSCVGFGVDDDHDDVDVVRVADPAKRHCGKRSSISRCLESRSVKRSVFYASSVSEYNL